MAPLFQRCYILAGRKKTKIFFQYVFESVRWVNRRKMGNFELYSGTFYKRGNLLNQPTFWGSFNILRLPPPNLPKTLKATWAMLSCGFRSVFHRAWKIKRSIIKTFWYSGRKKEVESYLNQERKLRNNEADNQQTWKSSALTGWIWSYRKSGWRLSTHSSKVLRPW